MEPLISVIIPVYNVQPYLCEALDSVLKQTYQNLEILVVDDGSNDNSEEICDEYAKKDSRITVIHQKNMGLSAARNVGLSKMTGDFVAFLDPDDAFCPDMIRKMYNAAQKYGADLVECNFGLYHTERRMNSGTIALHAREIRVKEGAYSKELASELALKGRIYPNAWNKLYRRKIWDTLRYPEGQLHEDVYLLQPILSFTETIYIINEPLYMHRIRMGSIATTYTIDYVKDLISAYNHSWDFVSRGTPSLCNENLHHAAMQLFCRTLLANYAKLAVTKQTEKSNMMADIREEIKSVREKMDTRKCSIEIKGATFLYDRTPPIVFALIFKAYYFQRMLALKIFTP